MSTLNGFPVIRGSVSIPRIGNWHADLVIETRGIASGAPAALDLGEGLVMQGTVVRGGDVRGVSRVRIVGGAGALSNLARPKAYQSPLLRVVAGDLIRDAGETLAELGRAGSHVLRPAWTTDRRPTGEVLAALVAAAPTGTVWRVLSDGRVWIGEETWPASTTEAVELEVIPENEQALLGPFLPTLLPATTFGGKRVDYVVHRLSGGSVRTEVLFRDDARAVSTDRAKDSLEAMVRSIAGPNFAARWRYRVVKQDGGLVDCVPDPDTGEMPNLTAVPIKHGVPGLEIALAAGARVMVGFENHDRRRPFVSEWDEGATVLEAVFNALQVYAGGKALAEPAIKGTTYRIAEDAYLAAIVAALQACLSSLGKVAEGQALAAAATAWSTASVTFLATNAKVK